MATDNDGKVSKQEGVRFISAEFNLNDSLHVFWRKKRTVGMGKHLYEIRALKGCSRGLPGGSGRDLASGGISWAMIGSASTGFHERLGRRSRVRLRQASNRGPGTHCLLMAPRRTASPSFLMTDDPRGGKSGLKISACI
jgi:hypothetical protein